MPWFSFHGGHSGTFCRHARNDLEQVIQRAVAAGFSHYGLSEHAPRFRDEDLGPDEADLTPADLTTLFLKYKRKAEALRESYADRIKLFVGFETERLPPHDWVERMKSLRGRGFDYVVGSVHDVGGQWVDHSPEMTRSLSESLGGSEALHLAYFDAVADLVSNLRPEVVGHLDLVRKFEPPGFAFSPNVMRRISDVLEVVRAAGSVLDVNCSAWRRGLGPVYPLPEILERARSMGVGVTLGDDSHGVDGVGVGLEASLEAIAKAGYREARCLVRLERSLIWEPVALGDIRPGGQLS
jgi:histidinol-phosphatase (PHP family)